MKTNGIPQEKRRGPAGEARDARGWADRRSSDPRDKSASPPPAAPRTRGAIASTADLTPWDYWSTYRAWDRGSRIFRGRYAGIRGFRRAVEALTEPLRSIRSATDLVATWSTGDHAWTEIPLAQAGLGLGTDHLEIVIAEAYRRRFQELRPIGAPLVRAAA